MKDMRHPGLLNDIMFKIAFGNSQSTSVLRALLNALLDLRADDRIVDLEILNPASNKTYLTQMMRRGPKNLALKSL